MSSGNGLGTGWTNAWIGLLWVLCLATPALARGGPDLLIASGTTIVDGVGQGHVYLAWDVTEPGRLRGKRFSVHGKPGLPDGTGAFVLLGQVPPPRTAEGLEPIVAQSARLGFGAAEVGPVLDALGVTAGLPLAARLAEIVGRASTNEVVELALGAVARGQPILELALGRAWSGPVPGGTWTYELRELDAATSAGGAVVARVTLDPGALVPLPAPGAPFQVQDLRASGDRRIRMRWSSPAGLRRRLALSRGYDLWRVPRADAEARQWFVQAPSIADLVRGALRVNESPILVARELDEAGVRDPALDIAHFTDDAGRDSGAGLGFADGSEWAYVVVARDLLGRPGLASLAGSARACWTATPRSSQNLHAEGRVEAGSGASFVRLEWDGESAEDPLAATHYEIHRGSDLREHRPGFDPDPATLIETVESAVGPVAFEDRSLVPESAHSGRTYWYAVRPVRVGPCGPIRGAISAPVLGGLRTLAGPPAPQGTVEGSCGLPTVVWRPSALMPDPSPPGNGRVRCRIECRRIGPGIVWTEVRAVLRGGARVVEFGRTWYPAEDDVLAFDLEMSAAEGDAPLELSCVSGSAGGRTSPGVPLPASLRAHPGTGQLWVARAELAEWTARDLVPGLPQSAAYFAEPTCFRVRSADASGRVTLELGGNAADRYALYAIPAATNGGDELPGGRFVGLVSPQSGVLIVRDPGLVGADPNGVRYCGFRFGPEDCSHVGGSEGGGGVVRGPRVLLDLSEGVRSYRIFRRIDDGELTLVATGICDGRKERQVLVEDWVVPSGGGRVCYFGQVLDEHSNPSPNTLLGCVEVAAVLPVPILMEPQQAGSTARVRLRWYAPEAGVDRFEVFLQPEYGELQARPLGAVLTGKPTGTFHGLARHAVLLPGASAASRVFSGEQWLTGRVGADLGPGPEFSVDVDVDEGRPYLVWLKAVGSDGRRGNPSLARRITWRRPQAEAGVVPWPARPVPATQAFHPLVRAVLQPGCETISNGIPVGVRIGAMPWSDGFRCADEVGRPVQLAVREAAAVIADLDPGRWLFREATGSPPRPEATLLPAVLYREQVANAEFPKVAGDLVQVSPMIERIAWGTTRIGSDRQVIWMLDPHVVMKASPNFGQAGLGAALELFIGDTHPVVSGARYRYWLVRLDGGGELESIIPAGEVEVP